METMMKDSSSTTRFVTEFETFLVRLSHEALFAYARTCTEKLEEIRQAGFDAVNEGFNPDQGTKPINLIPDKFFPVFANQLESSFAIDDIPLREEKIVFDFFKSDNPVDIAIRALQNKLLGIGSEASMKVYIAFTNMLEKTMQGGVTAREPLFVDAGKDADVLYVIFAGMVCFPEFKKSVASLGQVDQLHILDPHRSWYMQGPGGEWDGYAYYSGILEAQLCKRKSEKHYRKICFLGNSMGGSAACLFSPMADAVLAFCPQTEAVMKDIPVEEADRYKRLLRENIEKALSAGVQITVHRGVKPTDIDQCSRLPSGVDLVVHEACSEHNVPGYLKSQGRLPEVLGSVV